MKVLVVSAPALRAAGHDVLVAAGGDAVAADTAGQPVRDIGREVNLPAIALRLALAHPLLSRAARLVDAAVALVGEWRPEA